MSCRRTPETLPATALKIFEGMRRVSGSRRFVFQPGDEVEALVELREQARDLGGVVLEVAVDRDDDVAGRLGEAGIERRRLAEVAPQADDAHVVVGVVEPRERAEGAVGRAVVDEDRLPGRPSAVERGGELVVEQRDALLLVVHGDDDRDHAARVPARHLV